MKGTHGSGVAALIGGLFRGLRDFGEYIRQERDRYPRAEAQLRHFADCDPLTDLFNRRRFEQDLERQLALARRQRTHGAVLLLDLDQFKSINDSFGHWAGDEFLKSLASLLRARLRKNDVIGRLGGDEFAILLPRTDASQVQTVAGHILEEVRRHTVAISGQAVSTTTSIGIAVFPDHGTTVKELLMYADRAMYRSKESGRNGYYVYEPDPDARMQVEARASWENRFGRALEGDLFVLYCQPILDLRRSRVSRYELLLRMESDGSEPVSVGAYLGHVEQTALVHDIDRWVVGRAIRLIAEHQRAGRDLCVEVNLSAKAFSDTDLLPMIRHELAVTSINPANLVLEIAESGATVNLDQAERFVDSLRELGCQFALDDFGIGFSSFYNLRYLPADYVKIDGGFIQNLPQDPVAQHLVKAMVEAARGFGKQVIAEYVGDAETALLLRQYGSDYAQGYYIGRPSPLSEIFNGHGKQLAAESPMMAPGTERAEAPPRRGYAPRAGLEMRRKLEPPRGYASWLDYAIRTMNTWDLYVMYLVAGQDVGKNTIQAAASAELDAAVALKEAVDHFLDAHAVAIARQTGDWEDTPLCQCQHCRMFRAASSR